MRYISSDYRRVVLDCLGGDQLRNLSLTGCEDVDPIVELLSRKNLEILSFWNCKLIPFTDAAAFAERVPRAILTESDPFLPELKELKTKVTCLGYWSRLFECHRPSLVKLRLNCSHIGLSSVSRYDWSDTPSLWPNLKELGLLDNESNSPLNALKSISPHLNEFQHLQKLIVSATTPSQIGFMSTSYVTAQIGHPLPIGLRVEIWESHSTYCNLHQEREQNLL